jgi:membrane protein involved in colicin uptake
MPDYSEGKALIENIVKGKSTRFQEELKRLEEAAVAKAAFDENARLEAEAEAKIIALREAEAKAAAELKAKQDVEAKAAATKKITITCVKGKIIKKVSGVKPRCPAGYKKK